MEWFNKILNHPVWKFFFTIGGLFFWIGSIIMYNRGQIQEATYWIVVAVLSFILAMDKNFK